VKALRKKSEYTPNKFLCIFISSPPASNATSQKTSSLKCKTIWKTWARWN